MSFVNLRGAAGRIHKKDGSRKYERTTAFLNCFKDLGSPYRLFPLLFGPAVRQADVIFPMMKFHFSVFICNLCEKQDFHWRKKPLRGIMQKTKRRPADAPTFC